MSDYLIYKPANQSLDEIWQFSRNQWNEKQANQYISGLFDKIQEAASREIFWHSVYRGVQLNAFFVKYKRHYIFFRELEEGVIGVISIIHDNRKIVSLLDRDIEKIR